MKMELIFSMKVKKRVNSTMEEVNLKTNILNFLHSQQNNWNIFTFNNNRHFGLFMKDNFKKDFFMG